MFTDSRLFFRLFSIIIVFTVTVIATFACFGNLTDPESNMQFVRHIFSMDTTYNSPMLMWRAITIPALHWVGFSTIILFEFITAVSGWIGVVKMVTNLKADEEVFNSKKALAFFAMFMAVVIWGFIFQAAGGEWFASWQSPTWNGLRDATRIVLMAIGGGIALRLAK